MASSKVGKVVEREFELKLFRQRIRLQKNSCSCEGKLCASRRRCNALRTSFNSGQKCDSQKRRGKGDCDGPQEAFSLPGWHPARAHRAAFPRPRA